MNVYYVNLQRPWRVILEVEVTILVCKKFTWAVDQRGARRLLGASAFFTLASAERAKIGALMKLVKPTVAAAVPKVYNAALAELVKYDAGYASAARRQFTKLQA
jgi:hypothetical protein